jgi:F-type H+-transporting ATPase subunit b
MGLQKSLLGVLTLLFIWGIGFYLRERPVSAQAARVQSSTPNQTPNQTTNQSSVPSVDQQEIEVDENAAYRESPAVRKIGSWLGMGADRSANVFEFTNFALLALLVCWGLVKILPKTLRGRTESIQKHLVDARTATEEARARLSSVEERLSRLDGEIAAIRAQAEQDSAKEEQRIKASVEEEKKKILASAEQEIASATMHAQKQLQQHAAELAIEQAARKLVVSAETDRLLVQGFAQRLAGDESKKGQN